MTTQFEPADYWKALILYGLNQATYKIALGKSLLQFINRNKTSVNWIELSEEFFIQYKTRLQKNNGAPQQSIPARQTEMEKIVYKYELNNITYEEAISEVGKKAFSDVINRFHNLGNYKELQGMFYDVDFGKKIILKNNLWNAAYTNILDFDQELDARWSLLEGAFLIYKDNWELTNDIRKTYLINSHSRTALTNNIPFLQGYQGNTCFYCGEPIIGGDCHVDHVLPRQVIQHDEIWNLVLTHSLCNEDKSDKIVGNHFIAKLYARNENIMGSNHPWKHKISAALGKTPNERKTTLLKHYENVKQVLGKYYWGGSMNYNPSTDQFYKKLITVLNNKNINF